MDKTERPKASDPIPGVPLEARSVRVALFVLSVVSAAAALFLQPALAGAVRRGALPAGWLFLPLGLYGVFFLLSAVDRWLLVRRRRYPPGRALFQIVFGVVFGLLLLPSTIGDWSGDRLTGDARLLAHPDPEVRRAAVEALGFRGRDDARAEAVRARLGDPDPAVRGAAAAVLDRWAKGASSGTNDVGNGAGEGASTASVAPAEGAL